MLTNQIHPTELQSAHLKSYPKNTIIEMLNILKFKASTTANEPGRDAYMSYLNNVSSFVSDTKAKLIWKVNVHTNLIGNLDNQPQLVFLVEYPFIDHFFNLISNPAYLKITANRWISLNCGGLITCQTTQ